MRTDPPPSRPPRRYRARGAPAGARAVPLPVPPERPLAPTAAEIASDYIRTLIFRGVLRDGEQIPIDEIADLLGISRQPIREALITLAHDDLVVAEPKRGTFVGPITVATVLEHYDLFGMLAARSVARLVAAADPAVVARLGELHAALEAPDVAADPPRHVALLTQFQRFAHHAAATPRLSGLLRSMQRFVPGEVYLEAVPSGPAVAAEFRLRLFDALERHDVDAGRQAVLDQLRTGGQLFADELTRRGVLVPAPDDLPGARRD
jgi:DNA-binding GntR family transcriptional regulator